MVRGEILDEPIMCNEKQTTIKENSNRSISFFKQYRLIFHRLCTQISRQPFSCLLITFLGMLEGLMQSAIYSGVGDF